MDWSYVAGYFDGEGHVSLHPDKRGSKTRALSWYNTHLESLEAMRNFMGCGSIQVRNRRGREKPAYILTVTRKADLLHVVDNMLPHLIIKRAAAEQLRQYLATVGDESPNFGKMAAVSDEQLRRWYYDEGLSCGEIAARVGVSYSAAHQAMRVRNMPRRGVGGGYYMKGNQKPEQTRQRMRESRRELWKNPEFRATQLKNLEKGRNKLKAMREEGDK